jgi:hypothetical protein
MHISVLQIVKVQSERRDTETCAKMVGVPQMAKLRNAATAPLA